MLSEAAYVFVDFHDGRNIDPFFPAIPLYSSNRMKEKHRQKLLPFNSRLKKKKKKSVNLSPCVFFFVLFYEVSELMEWSVLTYPHSPRVVTRRQAEKKPPQARAGAMCKRMRPCKVAKVTMCTRREGRRCQGEQLYHQPLKDAIGQTTGRQ